MAQVAKEGVDFRLICLPHFCHKTDKYLSRFFYLAIADHVSDTFRRRDYFRSVCNWSKSVVVLSAGRSFFHI